MDKNTLISQLGLEPHPEGGYFRRTYTSPHTMHTPWTATRPALSSIYYMLTDDSPIGRWHRNQADILHLFHLGEPLTYWIIDTDGKLSREVLGPDLANGQHLQLLVPGDCWKASELRSGEYGLLSEAVSPGFDYADWCLGDSDELSERYPEHRTTIRRLSPARAAQ